jgi:hypothetical protein
LDFRFEVNPSDFLALIAKKKRILDKATERILNEQADAVLDAWRDGASGKSYPGMSKPLYSTSYANDLVRTGVKNSGQEWTVEIAHKGQVPSGGGKTFDLVKTVETGREPRDIKDGALRGPKAKRSKDGTIYAIIPFRHGSGESVHFKSNVSDAGKRVIRNYGELNEATAMTIANPWERQRALGPKKTKFVTEPVSSRSPWAHTTPQTGRQRFVGPGVYIWQRHLRSGMRRYGTGHQGKYMTFRTISTKSDPLSWISPRVAPNRIFKSMVMYMTPRVRAMMAASLRAIE